MRPEPERFFDGESRQPGRPMRIVLDRELAGEQERFALVHRIAYQDRHHPEPHVVPADPTTFRSDLTSVPTVFTWLVPRTGVHLPAALLHDGLVVAPGEPMSFTGPAVDRAEADRIFRDAMADLGTGLLRRWLIWTAVTLATVAAGVPPVRTRRLVVFGTLAVVVVLGVLATLDLLDVADLLPWMGDRSLGAELLGGAAGAVVVPALFAAAWGRFWRAGLIAGIALALLIHVTLVLTALTVAFQLADGLATRATSGRGTARAQPGGPDPGGAGSV
jgi:hypothetical protein